MGTKDKGLKKNLCFLEIIFYFLINKTKTHVQSSGTILLKAIIKKGSSCILLINMQYHHPMLFIPVTCTLNYRKL